MKNKRLEIQREIEDSELIVVTIGGCLFLLGIFRLLGTGTDYFIITLIILGFCMIINRFIQKRKLK